MLTSVVTCADCPGVDRSAAASTGPASDPSSGSWWPDRGICRYTLVSPDTCNLHRLDCDIHMEKMLVLTLG